LRTAPLEVGGEESLTSDLEPHFWWDAPLTSLSLSLFVFRVFADDSDDPSTFNDFTFITDFLD